MKQIGEIFSGILLLLAIPAAIVYLFWADLQPIVATWVQPTQSTIVTADMGIMGPLGVIMPIAAVVSVVWALRSVKSDGEGGATEIDRSCPRWVDVKIV